LKAALFLLLREQLPFLFWIFWTDHALLVGRLFSALSWWFTENFDHYQISTLLLRLQIATAIFCVCSLVLGT
jgi:hypothetical protein